MTAARDAVASLQNCETGAYRHKDLALVDLTGRNAIGTPLGLTLNGLLGKLAVQEPERTAAGSQDV